MTHVPLKTNKSVSMSWERAVGLLAAYSAEFGDCNVPYFYSEDNFLLGLWVARVRLLKLNGALEPKEIDELNELGFIWDMEQHKRRILKESTKLARKV